MIDRKLLSGCDILYISAPLGSAKEFKDSSIIVFSEKDMDVSHPIIAGRNDQERLYRVIAFTGESFIVENGSKGFLKFGDLSVDRIEGQN